MTYLGEDVPKLGFGLMRLPHIDNSSDKPIDIEKTKEMVDLFLKSGFIILIPHIAILVQRTQHEKPWLKGIRVSHIF